MPTTCVLRPSVALHFGTGVSDAWRGLPQKAVNSIERDENYVPHLRSQYNLPPKERATTADYAEVFEETPLFTAVRMFVMQAM